MATARQHPQLLGSISPLLLPLLLLLSAAASPAQSVAVTTSSELCLSQGAAQQAQDPTQTVICGFPLPPGPADSAIPFACSRQSDNIAVQLSKEPGLQDLTGDKICYKSYKKPDKEDGIVSLKLEIVSEQYASSGPVQARLLDSVSELVGTSSLLQVSGSSLVSFNPAVFSGIGPTQKAALKYLILIGTGLTSIDISLLEPLNIKGLVLISNQLLSRITNYKGIRLPNLQELVMWSNNKSLTDCRNFLALQPSGLKESYLIEPGVENSCSLCYLPAISGQVSVNSEVQKLKYHPGVIGVEKMPPLPFPLGWPYSDSVMTPIPDPVPIKQFAVGPGTAVDCKANCSCKPWPQPVAPEASKTSGGTGKEQAAVKDNPGGAASLEGWRFGLVTAVAAALALVHSLL